MFFLAGNCDTYSDMKQDLKLLTLPSTSITLSVKPLLSIIIVAEFYPY